jgi:signal transduction histidine kinase/ActR/RegA family two-component response regulator
MVSHPDWRGRLRALWLLAAVALAAAEHGSHPWPMPGLVRPVVRIGADDAPPYYVLNSQGPLEGLAVDTLNAAAARAGITLVWVPVWDSLDQAMAEGRVDLWPAVGKTPGRSARYYFTEPWLTNNFCLISLAGSLRPGAKPKRLALRDAPLVRRLAKRHLPDAALLPEQTRASALVDVCEGVADAALVEARFLDTVMLARPAGCESARFRVTMIPGATSDLRIMAQPQSAAVADVLQEHILELALDGTLSGILEKWASFSSVDARSVYVLQAALQRSQYVRYALYLLLAGTGVLAWQFARAQSAERRAREAQALAEQANATKSEFLANMSHEIRTPLNGVLGMTSLVLDGPLDETKRADLETVRDSAQVLLHIINDILDLSAIESGRINIEKVDFQPRVKMAKIAELFKPHAKSKGVTLTWASSGDVPARVRGDVTRVQQILANYVANAVKFTHAGSVHLRATVAARDESHVRLRFEVQDTGIGIPAAKQALLFSKFVQADPSTRRKYGGTGLGLAISKTLAELMGGQVGLSSEEGRGATFWVELPFEIPGAVEEAAAGATHVPALDFQPAILVVEDNEVNRRLAVRLLMKMDCRVETAVNGSEALRMWESTDYDLILMDCQMPDVDGYEAAARIRQCETPEDHTPIVALTAHAMPGDAERCRDAGMDDYLKKPVQFEALAAMVHKWARRRPQTARS